MLLKDPGVLLKDPGVLLKDPGCLLKDPGLPSAVEGPRTSRKPLRNGIPAARRPGNESGWPKGKFCRRLPEGWFSRGGFSDLMENRSFSPGTPFDRPGPPRTSICTKNQPRKPILRPFRDDFRSVKKSYITHMPSHGGGTNRGVWAAPGGRETPQKGVGRSPQPF